MPPQYPIQTAVLQGMHYPLVFQDEAGLGLRCGGRVFLIMNEGQCLILRTKKTNDVRFGVVVHTTNLSIWVAGARGLGV